MLAQVGSTPAAGVAAVSAAGWRPTAAQTPGATGNCSPIATMITHTSSTAIPAYPRLQQQIAENPARWLSLCSDGLTPTVRSLLDGMGSLERALNWRYVARQLDIPASVRNAIDARIDDLEQRRDSYSAQACLREVYHAPPNERTTVIERAVAAGRDDVQVVVALANQLDAATDEPATDAVDDSPDMTIERAREIADSVSHDRAIELLAMERNKDAPREPIVRALAERVEPDAADTQPASEVSA